MGNTNAGYQLTQALKLGLGALRRKPALEIAERLLLGE